ncbi:hypothetical protein GCM10009779_66140 [Polymorphospora rubra]
MNTALYKAQGTEEPLVTYDLGQIRDAPDRPRHALTPEARLPATLGKPDGVQEHLLSAEHDVKGLECGRRYLRREDQARFMGTNSRCVSAWLVAAIRDALADCLFAVDLRVLSLGSDRRVRQSAGSTTDQLLDARRAR